MDKLRLGIIGTGWIGENRARTAAADGRVAELHLADLSPEAGANVGAKLGAHSVVDHRELLNADTVDAVIVSTAPETTHYPIARDCLMAGKHLLLEKPMALTIAEADELLALARSAGVLFTVGYTQRFHPKFAFVRQQIALGAVGGVTSVLISRHLARDLGAKICRRGELGPAQMEATHDIDLALWWLAPAHPVRVYAQSASGIMRSQFGLPDCTWVMVTMDNGSVVTIGADWSLPVDVPGFSSVIAEVVGREGAVFVDESHRDLLLSTVVAGLVRPLSTMPGERIGPVYQGPMEAETRHFIDCVVTGSPPLVQAEQARVTMQVALAADQSVACGGPVDLPPPSEVAR
jgi:predicted dehydrogenase